MLLELSAIAAVVIVAVVLFEWRRTSRLTDVDIDSCLTNVGRLDALAATKLMDAPPRKDLDELTLEAARRLHAPMAVMSLIDERRVFVASAFGLTGDIALRREAPVHDSYCKYVVARNEPLKVDDSIRHRLVKNHPATRDGTRSYLGVPIRTKSGHTIGSFCVVDTVARKWNDDDMNTLENIAGRAMAVSSS